MNLIELQNDFKKRRKKLQEKNKNANDYNGGTVTRVVKTGVNILQQKKKKKKNLSVMKNEKMIMHDMIQQSLIQN